LSFHLNKVLYYLDIDVNRDYIGLIKLISFTAVINLMGQLLVVAHHTPVRRRLCVMNQNWSRIQGFIYCNIVGLPLGSGIRNNEKNQRHAAGLYVRARFCSYVFLSKHVWVNMNLSLRLNLGRWTNGPLNNAAGTRVEPQASSSKLDSDWRIL